MAPAAKRRVRIAGFEIILILFAILVIAGSAYLFLQGRNPGSRTEVFEERLKELRRLKTVNQIYRSVIYVEAKNVLQRKRFVLFTIEYNVVAGIDFSRGVEIFETREGTVEVRLPPAEIFAVDADEGSINQMLLREGLFPGNAIGLGDYMPQIIDQGEANRRSAINGGILERAEHNAQIAVRRILGLGGVGNVVFSSPRLSPETEPDRLPNG